MSHDPDSLVELCTVPREMDAPWIVDYLADHGVEAKALPLGVTIYGSHAGAPHRVVVRRGDLEVAKAVLRKRDAEAKDFDPSAIDWSQVDTGDDSPLREDEINPPGPVHICPDCGYEPDPQVGAPAFCPRCGVRSQLVEARSRSGSDRAALWLFVILMAMLAAMALGGMLV